jgi:ABC-type amino acid transport substrate-binding protein
MRHDLICVFLCYKQRCLLVVKVEKINRLVKYAKIAMLVLAILLVVTFHAQVFAAKALKVGLPEPGQVPFMWVDEDDFVRGIYADTIRLIAKDIGIDVEFVALSQARLIRHFIAGEIDIEMGVANSIQEPAELSSLSVYSAPFGFANEVIIYKKALRFPAFILKDLKDQKVAVVRGTQAPDYIRREDFSSPLQIAKRVSRGWSEVGLMAEASAMHYKFNDAMNYEISLPYQSKAVRIRLHQQHFKLIDKVNKSIVELQMKGALENIICDYLCGK